MMKNRSATQKGKWRAGTGSSGIGPFSSENWPFSCGCGENRTGRVGEFANAREEKPAPASGGLSRPVP